MAHTVFIDGEAGTTGLQIRQRLEGRRDLEIVSIDPARRKDADARAELLHGGDAVVRCLPDDAGKHRRLFTGGRAAGEGRCDGRRNGRAGR